MAVKGKSIKPRNIKMFLFTLFVTPADVGSVLSVEQQVNTLLFST